MRPFILKSHTRPLTTARYNQEGDLLFTCAKDQFVSVWFNDDGERVGTYNGHTGAVWYADPSRDSTLLLTGSADASCKLWDISNGETLLTWKFPEPCRIAKFGLGDRIAVLTTDPFMGTTPRMHIVNVSPLGEDQECNQEVVMSIDCPKKITRAFWTDQNRILLSASEDGMVRRYDVETGELLSENKVHDAAIQDIDMAKDGTHFLSSSIDKTAKLIDTKSLSVLKTYQSDRPVNSSAMHPTFDHVIVAGGQDASQVTTTSSRAGGFETVFYHKIYTQEFGRVRGHFGPVNTVAISPDGRSFVTGGEDGFVRLQHLDMDYFSTRFF